MNTSTPQPLIAELPKELVAQENPTLPPWHKPTITRIELKRTMNNSGPINDTLANTPNN